MTINPKDIQSAGKKVAGTALVLAGVGTFIWVSMVLVDILSFYFAYWASHNILENYGVDEYTAKMISAVFALIIALLAHGLLWSIIKRNHKRWIPAVTATMLLWFGIMYAISSPYVGSPFNPFNGQTQKYYRDQFQKLHTIGRGATVGPYGEPVILFDKTSAQEYERQQNSPEKKDLPQSKSTTMHTPDLITSLFSMFTSKQKIVDSDLSCRNISMWIEKIEITPNSTVLHLAVKSSGDDLTGYLDANNSSLESYLVDENGYVSEFIGEQHTTPGRNFTTQSVGCFMRSEETVLTIRPQEVYRYTATFKPLAPNMKQLAYHSRQFKVVPLDKLLASAERTLVSSVLLRERELYAKQMAEYEAQRIEESKAEDLNRLTANAQTAAIAREEHERQAKQTAESEAESVAIAKIEERDRRAANTQAAAIARKENELQAKQAAEREAEDVARTKAEERDRQAVDLQAITNRYAVTQQPHYAVYPQRRQSPQQFSRDTFECQTWAAQQVGYYGGTTLTQDMNTTTIATNRFNKAYVICMTGRGYIVK